MAKKQKRSTTKQQWVIVGLFTLAVFTAGGFTSVIMMGGSSGGSESETYRNTTMTDAYLDCEKHLKQKLDERLKSYQPDNLSTRYDQAKQKFLIFFQADVEHRFTSEVSVNYVTCEVANSGKITRMDFSSEDGSPGTGSDSSNPFGYDP